MKNKTLFFRNLFSSVEGKEDNSWLHQATFFLASSFTSQGLPIVLSTVQFSADGTTIKNLDSQDSILQDKDINLVVITLVEGCFTQVRTLIGRIRQTSDAFIAVGGIMPTLSPEHVFFHLKQANLIARGEGEHLLPAIQKILSGADIKTKLSKKKIEELKNLKGLFFRNSQGEFKSADSSMNLIKDLDSLSLDFSLLGKDQVATGINLSMSRGCRNSCLFCTMPCKGFFRAISAQRVMALLQQYEARLIALFGRESRIPPQAYTLSFNDDDFLADRDRAIRLFSLISKTRFRIGFIQASVNSFFIGEKGKPRVLDTKLIAAMDPGLFAPPYDPAGSGSSIFLGTENFNDQELLYLRKGYTFAMVEVLVQALSERKIRQAHHFIVSNTYTSVESIMDNLLKIAILRHKYPSYFTILKPVITHLVSLYPSQSYETIKSRNMHGLLQLKELITDPAEPELDYPCVEKDIPLDKDVAEIADRINDFLKPDDYPLAAIEKIMMLMLKTHESLMLSGKDPIRAGKLMTVIRAFHNYQEQIFGESPTQPGSAFSNSIKSNMQLMLTRRCQLRCSYCPVQKKDADMDQETAFAAVDLLMQSGRKNLRIDFTGGEPLLQFDLMRETMEYAEKKAKENRIRLSFYIVTNALLLKKEVVEYLSKKDVLIELSIDGTEEIHNMCKIPIDKKINPYLETIANARQLLSRKIPCFVVLVATPDQVSSLSQSFSHLLELGFSRIEVNYAIGRYWDSKSTAGFFSELEKIIAAHRVALSNGKIELGNIFKRKEPACLNAEIMVDTDGSLHLLSEFLYKTRRAGAPVFHFSSVNSPTVSIPPATPFTVYYSLVSMFAEKDPAMRRILDNNIRIGISCKKFFRQYADFLAMEGDSHE